MLDMGYKLPDKLYFRIGEVSDLVGVKPYVLRYWESEFTDIKPTKSKSGQRLYKKKEVELLLKIKELLYNERFTISGAKQRLKELGRAGGNGSHCEEIEAPREEEKVEAAVQEEERPSKVAVGESANSHVDVKFLQKMKTDLEWCITELKSA